MPGTSVDCTGGPFINITYQNVRGLNTKIKHFRTNLALLESDVVAVTESWLTESVNSSELLCCGWSMVRRDRASGRHGGGVFLAARPGIVLRRRQELETAIGEDLWTTFTVEGTTVHMCVVYIPPNVCDDVYMSFFYKVESVIDSLKGVVVIMGDLNLNPKYTSVSVLSYFCYFAAVCDLKEMNDVSNAFGGMLDVVLVRGRMRSVGVTEIEDGALVQFRDAYHPPLEITVPLLDISPRQGRANPSNVDSRLDWNFPKGDYVLLRQLISEVSWSEVHESRDVNVAVDLFYRVVYDIFDICIPKKRRSFKPSRRYPVWFTADLIKNISRKAALHQEWKRTGDREVYANFSKLRADIKLWTNQAYDIYVSHIQNQIRKNPCAFWNHIGSLRSKGGYKSQVTYEDEIFEDSGVADAFSRYFSSVFLPSVPVLDHDRTIREDLSCSSNYINIVEISIDDINTSMGHLKGKSSPGPDNFPAFILKGCSEWLSSPLLHIFNLALSTGVYPDRWKVTRVSPIPKSHDASDVEEHRPIAILSSVAKLFESILNRLIAPQVKPYLCDAQHGFRPKRSVDTNLLTLVDSISEHLDKGIQVDVLYFDFKKAFDRVDNDILLKKLCEIGFSPLLLKFFASYLRDRQQFVQHGCFVSETYHTRSGVSQGSILGPLLFGIMINDLAEVPRCARCLLYADDLKLIYGVQRESDCGSLQEDIDRVFQWSAENRLLFNASKCSVITFSRSHCPVLATYTLGSVPIVRVNIVRDLGVIFDSRLNFHEHMKLLAINCYRRLGFVVRSLRDFSDPVAIKLVYTSLVRSKLEAASVVWNPYESTYVLLLEKIQKAFLRFFYKKMYGYYPFLYPTKFLLGVLGFNSLEVRRNYALLTMACNALRGDSDSVELVMQLVRLHVPPVTKFGFRPRHRHLLAVPCSRTVARKQSPLIRALHYVNALLASAPECDVLAGRWKSVCVACIRFCEVMDSRLSSCT